MMGWGVKVPRAATYDGTHHTYSLSMAPTVIVRRCTTVRPTHTHTLTVYAHATHHTTPHHTTGDAVASANEDPLSDYVVLSIDVGDKEHILPVQRDADYSFVADRFCSARGVGNGDCVASIESEINSKFFQKAFVAQQIERERLAKRFEVETPLGDGVLKVPKLSEEVNEHMFEAVDTCRKEYDEEGMGVDCLLQQSELFQLRNTLGPEGQVSHTWLSVVSTSCAHVVECPGVMW